MRTQVHYAGDIGSGPDIVVVNEEANASDGHWIFTFHSDPGLNRAIHLVGNGVTADWATYTRDGSAPEGIPSQVWDIVESVYTTPED